MTAGFDVTTQVPLRGALFRVAPTEFVLVFAVHHIAADGYSIGPLTRDVMIAYAARAEGTHPVGTAAIQYADYALWQRENLVRRTIPPV